LLTLSQLVPLRLDFGEEELLLFEYQQVWPSGSGPSSLRPNTEASQGSNRKEGYRSAVAQLQFAHFDAPINIVLGPRWDRAKDQTTAAAAGSPITVRR
jgi:hypothetical protein